MASAPAAASPPPPAEEPVANKDKITCHVLDTTKGKPARGMRVRLELTPPGSHDPPSGSHHHVGGPGTGGPRTFESQTDEDGRVKAWLPYSASNASGEVPVYTLDDVLDELSASSPVVDGAADSVSHSPPHKSRWTLRFDTEAYFAAEGMGESTFFPEVAVVFEVVTGQQYHVPLLLSPFGYTTYRGS